MIIIYVIICIALLWVAPILSLVLMLALYELYNTQVNIYVYDKLQNIKRKFSSNFLSR